MVLLREAVVRITLGMKLEFAARKATLSMG